MLPMPCCALRNCRRISWATPAAATKEFQDYQKKYPHSPRKREVQEELAELALMKSAETGQMETKNAAPPPWRPTRLRNPTVRAFRYFGGPSDAVRTEPRRLTLVATGTEEVEHGSAV